MSENVQKYLQINIDLPLPLLEATYDFLWSQVKGLKVKRIGRKFVLSVYILSASCNDFSPKIIAFLQTLAKHHRVNCPAVTVERIENSQMQDFIITPAPASEVLPFGLPVLLKKGRAFGTGKHPCTIYSLQALQDIYQGKFELNKPKKILDAGAGTGILSIAAARLGAENIIAVEIDPEAAAEAKENVRLNQLGDKIRVLPCSVTEIEGKFDLIFANLYGILLKQMAEFFVERLLPGGRLVLGGMVVPDDEVVIEIFTQHGLKFCDRYYDEEWSVAMLRRGP